MAKSVFDELQTENYPASGMALNDFPRGMQVDYVLADGRRFSIPKIKRENRPGGRKLRA
jgi:hypothetical protein